MKSRVMIAALALLAASSTWPAEILNASYDVARELFDAVNPAFVTEWKAKTGETLVIRQSHAGSSKIARSVAGGCRHAQSSHRHRTAGEVGLGRQKLAHALAEQRLALLFAAGIPRAARQSESNQGLERSGEGGGAGRIPKSKNIR